MSAAYQIGADTVSDTVACVCPCGCYAPTVRTLRGSGRDACVTGRLCALCDGGACPGPSPWVWTPADLGIAPRNGHEVAMLAGDWWAADRCTALALVARITRAARGGRAQGRVPGPRRRRTGPCWRS